MPCDLERVERGVERDLELHDADVGLGDPVGERVDVLAGESRERPGHDDDAVLARRLDEDRRHHRRRVGDDGIRADALLRPQDGRVLAERRRRRSP